MPPKRVKKVLTPEEEKEQLKNAIVQVKKGIESAPDEINKVQAEYDLIKDLNVSYIKDMIEGELSDMKEEFEVLKCQLKELEDVYSKTS